MAAISVLLFLPGLIFSGLMPFAWRSYVLLSIAALFMYLAFHQGFTLEELGMKTGNIGKALRIQIPLVLFFLLLLSIAPTLGLASRRIMPAPLFFIFYMLVSAPCQEFIYRGYIYALLRRCGIENKYAAVFFLVIPFVFVHIIYHDFMIMLFTIVAGVFLSVSYIKEMNFFAVSFSHALLGFFAIMAGVI
ncbi:MAG: CPBP family intramembrane metalloprotease [Chlorobium sp.]|nr:MAG: CPBP family intramembrane metalloprotease [Chlorobium sp.]